MIIGITGGVGCGKSTVLNILKEQFGCHVIEADRIGHRVMEPGQPAWEEIVRVFGRNILAPDDTVDRKKLGDIVFREKDKLETLNRIVHPAVKAFIKKEIRQVSDTRKDAVIVIEAALLIEDNYTQLCDEVWYIYATEEVRLKRLMESRGYTKEKTANIMKNQLTELEFMAHCSKKIDNSYDMEHTYHQVKQIFDSYFSEDKNG